MVFGVLSVMITLTLEMHELFASFWDSLGPYVHIAEHALDEEVGLSGLIIFTVLALKVHHFTVLIMDLELKTAGIMKMLVLGVLVSHTINEHCICCM